MAENSTSFINPYSYTVIYAYTIHDEDHKGLIKVGKTTLESSKSITLLQDDCEDLNSAAKKRIDQCTNTAAIQYELLYTTLGIRDEIVDGLKVIKSFSDVDVHSVLKSSGIKKHEFKNSKAREWFKVSLEKVKEAIRAVREGKLLVQQKDKNEKHIQIELREEQKNAIKSTKETFKHGLKKLWNAKMRFGKTVTALSLVKDLKLKKVIIITHRPVVSTGWGEDFNLIFNSDDNYQYITKGNDNVSNDQLLGECLKNGNPFIFFVSIQDLRDSKWAGGHYDKNNLVKDIDWSLIIIDEAHEGTQTTLGDTVIKTLFKEEQKLTKLLMLSGTPFNIVGDFKENEIFTYSYIDEQTAKINWDKDHFDEPNPYESLPELRIYTYNLGELLNTFFFDTDVSFNFTEFFRTYIDTKVDADGNSSSEVKFVHEYEINLFLNLLAKKDDKNSYPFSNEEFQKMFRHSLWVVPGVNEAKALQNLMHNHPVFNEGLGFRIINVAGTEDKETKNPLQEVRDAIRNAEADGEYTITLSCGRLTTGVSIPEWTAVFMLYGTYSSSASSYLQTIFRVQTPCTLNGQMKKYGYVFDFAPDRTLKMVAESISLSHKPGKTKEDDRKKLGELLNFCPVISYVGSKMASLNINAFFEKLKETYVQKALEHGFDDDSLYNDTLLKIDEHAIDEFNDLKKIVGSSQKKTKGLDLVVNNQGVTNEEYEQIDQPSKPKPQLTPEQIQKIKEEQERKNKRLTAISILRSVSIRMPLLIFGSNVKYDEDITLKDFMDLVDNESWQEFMPSGLTKSKFKNFLKYYDEDIFIAAGKKIRKIAKDADDLEPVKRVEQIANLFKYFKNPDKETVLTPWRVVNMHMSMTLGGYDFYDENHENPLSISEKEPRFVDQYRVTQETLDNPCSKILEINSKTGLYPLYVTYSIYKAKCKDFYKNELTIEKKRELWFDTINKNVYVICKTPMAVQITKRTLVGYNDSTNVHARYFKDLIPTLKEIPEKFEKNVLSAKKWGIEGDKMKFDAVVGNPPYHLETSEEKNLKTSIYHLFINEGIKLSDRSTFIHPGRFLYRAGNTPRDWQENILKDPHFRIVKYFDKSNQIFPTVDIKGGIAITMYDKNQDFSPINFFTKFEELGSIKVKVDSCLPFITLSDIIYLQNKFNLENLYNDFPSIKEKIGSGGKERRLTSNIFELSQIFYDEKQTENDILIHGITKNVRVEKYINSKYIDLSHENLNKFKVLVPQANGSGAIGEVLSTPLIGYPLIGYTQSYISIGAFETEEEALSALKYVKTKFLRCMLGIKKVTQNNKKDTWEYVPLQDFSKNSDIDWSKSIKEIDQQLYKKYGLNENEIKFIEEKIKPME